MTSPTTKHARETEQVAKSAKQRWRKITWSLFTFVAGAVCSPIVLRLFIELLPGPKVGVLIQGMRGHSGNVIGCINYEFSVITDKPVENIFVKIQFLNKITGYRVGLPQEAHSAATGRMTMQAWSSGRNAKGECDILQVAIDDGTNITSFASGNMIRVSISRLPSDGLVIGVVATPEVGTFVTPPQKYFEGSYEYSMLSQTIRKPLEFIDGGIKDVK